MPPLRLSWRGVVLALAVVVFRAAPASALERLCDPSFEDCRAPILTLIANEKVGIDVGFWFMEDARYSAALIKRFQAGVPVRLLVDPRANENNPANGNRLKEMADAGIPMRKCVSSGIMHWKAMIFAGQNTVQFGSANYSAWAFVPVIPYVNYTDETVYFTERSSIVHTFMVKFDELWTSTTIFRDYANILNQPTRVYPSLLKDAALNFPTSESFAGRSVKAYNAETGRIDVMMYRITDRSHADAMIAAVNRGVTVRLLTEPKQYRSSKYLWDAWNVDRMYMAGVEVRMRAHEGLNHEKVVLLYNQLMTIFGSSNWTSASTSSQQEHNFFTNDQYYFNYFRTQFLRKWGNTTGKIETTAFVPLPPDTPVYSSPTNGTKKSTSGVRLSWQPGPWAHFADVYFGTSSNPPLVARNVAATPSSTAYYTLPTLTAGRTYYWKIVSKTAANQTKSGSIWSFGT